MFILTTAGSVDVQSEITVLNLDGTPKTDIVAATGLTLYYSRERTAATQITPLSDLGAANSAHADGGIIHKGAGLYRVDPPDAAFAAAAGITRVTLHGSLASALVIPTIHMLNVAPAINFNVLDNMTLVGTVVTVTDASTFTATLADRNGTAVSVTQANAFRNKSLVVTSGGAKYASADIASSSWDAGNSRTNFTLKSTRTLPVAMSAGHTFLMSAF